MKRIHLTESQLKYCLKKLKESDDIELAGDVKPGQTLDQAAKEATKQAVSNGVPANKTKIVFSGQELKNNNITENSKFFTKRDLKEARLNKLIQVSKMYTKKELSNRK